MSAAEPRSSTGHEFGITQNELRLLIEKVGNSAGCVRKEVEMLRQCASAKTAALMWRRSDGVLTPKFL
jgi:hypothetical protein